VETAEVRGLIRVTQDGRRRDVTLAHPLYGEVARRQCGAARAHRLLGTLADLVENAGARRRDDLLRVAVWRLDSGTAQHGRLLLDAAVQAFGRFDLTLAARLARAARDAGAGYEAAELLAFTLLFADQPEPALAVLRDAHDAPPARRDVALATVAYWGLAEAEAADRLAAAHPVDDPAAGAHMRAVEALMRLLGMDLARARSLARGVLEGPTADRPTREVARCVLAFLATVEGDPDTSARLIADVESVTAAWRRDTPALQYALPMIVGTRVSVTLDLPGIDRILSAEFAGLARTGGFGFGSGWVALLQAQAAWLRGRTRTALEACEQACAALAEVRRYAGDAHSALAHIAALRGDVELARSALAVADAAGGADNGLFYAWGMLSRAWTAASAGDIAGAVAVLQVCVTRARADGFAAYEMLALHDLVRLGRADLAADRMSTLVATTPAGPVAAVLEHHARAAAAEDAPRLFAVARQFFARDYLTFAAEAAASAVRLFRAGRDPRASDASTLLGDVLERCDTLNTPALRSVQASLTSRERQVAELAADGVKSRDIAERLYLSPRTVENHLQRVYAKLGVNSRTELAPALRSLRQ
jgi:DNA-binding NarL/FixJ family response regulator